MASASKGISGSHKRKIWDESPSTLTEFGALSSDIRPAGSFFTRLWKRNKDDVSHSVGFSSASLTDDGVSDKIRTGYPEGETWSASSSRGATPPPTASSVTLHAVHPGMTTEASAPSTLPVTVISNSCDQVEEGLDTQGNSHRVQHRTLTSVLSRLGSILDHRSATPQTYKDSDFKQYWMPDSSCRECYDCGDKFTTFRRRHHCRICGQIFCSKCCNQELPGKIIGYKGGIRVCTYCCRVVQRYAQQSATSEDLKALEDLRAISQIYNESGNFDFGLESVASRLSMGIEDLPSQIRIDSLPDLTVNADMNTPFDLTPQSEFSSQESLLLESKLLIQDSVQLRELWRQVCDMEAGVEIQTMRIRLRTHQNCIVGRELVDWLIKKDKAATRDQAMAIGQAFLYAGYLDCVGHQSVLFKDDFTLYRPGETAVALNILGGPETMATITEEMHKNEPLWFQEIGQAEDVDASSVSQLVATVEHSEEVLDLEPQKSVLLDVDSGSASETTQSGSFSEVPKIISVATRDAFDEPLPRQDSSVHGMIGDEILKGALFMRSPPIQSSDVITCPHGWRTAEQLREENGEKLAYDRLKRAHTGLWHALTHQLLSEQSLLLSWETVIYKCITQISHFVRPDVRLEGDDMDIRSYLHIKKVPGGSRNDTCLYHGVIFTKNVAHKKMKTKIVNPSILLLRGTIEFQRVENKFSSLEPQILQEREFMRNCVMKMVAYKPNIVVVEKSVSRLAQEYLLEAGVTLLFNVKPSVMERLARLTQADIVPSIDSLVSKPNMGFCHEFRIQAFNLANKEAKMLAIFDGCATHLGCTIVLRGGTASELKRVKHILKFMTYTAYNSLLELCFCMDEFAMPQPGVEELEHTFDGLDGSLEQTRGDAPCKTKKSSTSFEDKLAKETRISVTSESVDACSYQEGQARDQQLQTHLDTVACMDKDVDTLSMDYREGDKSTHSSELSSLAEFMDCEDKDVFDGEEVDRGSSPNLDARNDVWYDGERMLHTEEFGRHRRDTLEGGGEVNDKSRQDMTFIFENHFCADDDAAEMYAVTTAAATHSSMESLSTLPDTAMVSATSGNSSWSATQLDKSNSSMQREKVRHMSGFSGFSMGEVRSGRSTPDSTLRHDDAEQTVWDGSAKLIGNIMCIIPKSSLPVVVSGPLQGDSENSMDMEVAESRSSTEQVEVTLPANNSASSSLVTASEKNKSSEANSSDLSFQTDSGQEAVPLGSLREDSQSNSKNAADRNSSQSRASASILTELTDFSDPLLGYQNTKDESIFSSANQQTIALTVVKPTNYKRFRKALNGVHLSVSPYHKYSVPFIETDRGSRCPVRQYLPDEIFWSRLFDGEESQWQTKSRMTDLEGQAKALNKNSIQIIDAHPLITCKLTEPIWGSNTQTLLADFRARGGRILVQPDVGKQALVEGGNRRADDSQIPDNLSSGKLWEKKIDCLDPANHQRLMVLFSSFSYKSANHPYPCVSPWVVTMEFYGRHDVTLGGFLEKFCFRKQYSCPSLECDTPMTDHVRRFVHGNACINILLKKLDNEVPGGKENILMWSWCRKCKQVTPVVPISADTWNLSFAKYLDLRFHSSSFLRRGSAEPCPHSLHHDHFQYFGHRNIVASFRLAYISLKEVALPATTVTLIPPTFDAVKLQETVKSVTYKATDRYSQMLETMMKLKQELVSDVHIRAISEMVSEQQMDKKSFRDAASNVQMKINELIHMVTSSSKNVKNDADLTFHLYAIIDNIEMLRRKICEDVQKWNSRMQEFMLAQQKRSKLPGVNKKEKDTQLAAVDELDKSYKGNLDRSSKTFSTLSVLALQQSPSSAPAVTSSPAPAPSSLLSSTLASSSLVSKAAEESAAGENPDPQVPSEANANRTLNLVINPPTEILVTAPSPAPPPLSAPATPFTKDVILSAMEGPDDNTEGWFQDLKGATRRWLSTSSFTPVPLPFEPCEHHTLQVCEQVPIAVNDHEPSSIIAYALSSSDYICRLREIQAASRTSNQESNGSSSQSSRPNSKTDLVTTAAASDAFGEAGRKTGSGVLSFLRGVPSPQHSPHLSRHPVETVVRYVPGSSGFLTLNDDIDISVMADDPNPSPEEKPKVRSSAPSPHIELQFSDSAAKFYCRIYFADQFQKLRKQIFPGSDNTFIRSLSRCKVWDAKGGKSGSSFSKTDDDRFILKQMSSMEVDSFEKFGPQYFHYIKSCHAEQQPTALAKIMGVFCIGFRNTQTNHALRQDVLVMENLFYNRKITQKFDLKGSVRNRLVNTNSKQLSEDELVLLDENLLKCSVENPLYLRGHSKHILKSAITSDSAFLSANLVMDYSLLVGVDEDSQELVLGIIDYIRTFTWDKKLEMVVKSTGFLGGQGKLPTVVSPQLYRGRFLEAMDRYFLHVPDHWTGLGKDFPIKQQKNDAASDSTDNRK